MKKSTSEYGKNGTRGRDCRLPVFFRIWTVFFIFSWCSPGPLSAQAHPRAGGPYETGLAKLKKTAGKHLKKKRERCKKNGPCEQRIAQAAGRGVAGDYVEYKVKTGFIYNFGQFTEWPKKAFKNADSPFNICVLSDDPQVEAIIQAKLNRKTIKGRKIKVKIVTENRDLEGCHLLFLKTGDRKLIREKLTYVYNRNVLTVGETDGFLRMCGVINFVMEKKKLHFQVNENAGKSAGLKFSSQLLNSAKRVRVEGCGK